MIVTSLQKIDDHRILQKFEQNCQLLFGSKVISKICKYEQNSSSKFLKNSEFICLILARLSQLCTMQMTAELFKKCEQNSTRNIVVPRILIKNGGNFSSRLLIRSEFLKNSAVIKFCSTRNSWIILWRPTAEFFKNTDREKQPTSPIVMTVATNNFHVLGCHAWLLFLFHARKWSF